MPPSYSSASIFLSASALFNTFCLLRPDVVKSLVTVYFTLSYESQLLPCLICLFQNKLNGAPRRLNPNQAEQLQVVIKDWGETLQVSAGTGW